MTELNIPKGPHELTAAWLTTALRAGGAIKDATVRSAHVNAGIQEGMGFMGELARVNLDYERDEP
ncbi:MAG: hypothetical protein U1B78_01170, partial [Dehalococcoidia bacterium]|nr:hypothetical protein [Dehalococcoidia bacterium]